MKSKELLVVLLLVAAIATSGLFYKDYYNKENPDVSGPIVIRAAHVANEKSPGHIAWVYFKEILEERSGGRFEVQIYPNSQLGGDRQAVEATSLGIINATSPGTAILSGFEPKFMVTDLPFVFKTREAAYQAFDNELGVELNKLLEAHNIVNMGYTETGYRYITSNKGSIYSPEDMKNLSIRTMENPLHIQAFKAWGANPTPINSSELFTALQQNTIDAQEMQYKIIYTSRFYEVQDYLSLTGHLFASGSILFNKTFVDNLPDNLKTILEECSVEMIDYSRRITVEMEKEFLAELESLGMEINELTPEQKDLFIEKAQPVYDTFEKTYGAKLIDLATKYND